MKWGHGQTNKVHDVNFILTSINLINIDVTCNYYDCVYACVHQCVFTQVCVCVHIGVCVCVCTCS